MHPYLDLCGPQNRPSYIELPSLQGFPQLEAFSLHGNLSEESGGVITNE